jgi:hypothetical protein
MEMYAARAWQQAENLAGFDYAAGLPAKRIAHLQLPDAGLGCWSALADLDGDGRPEMVTVQCAFPYYLPANGSWGCDPAWSRVWCVTAIGREGRIMWRHGAPWKEREAFPNHGGAGLIVRDIDGDGKPEIVTGHMGTLYVIAADGTIMRRREFDGKVIVGVQPFPPIGKAQAFLVCLMSPESFEPQQYVFVDAATLDDTWADRPFAGDWGAAIPFPAADGTEGLLMNAWLYGADGRAVRRLPEEVFPSTHGVHADYIARGDLNGDGADEFVYCVEYHGYCEVVALDRAFNVIFRHVMGHAQTACIVPPSAGELGVVIVQDRSGCKTTGLDARGNVLWEQPLLAYPGPLVRRGDEMLICLWPHRMKQTVPAVVDRWGKVRERFQEMLDFPPAEIVSRYQRLAEYRSHDIGRAYQVHAADWNADGIDELIMNDRRGIWVYGNLAGSRL